MKGSRVVIIILSLILAITIIAGGAFYAYLSITTDGNEAPSIDEIIETSVDVPEVISNLADDDYIRISFKIQTDSKKAKTELEKRDFQVYNIIIQELSEMTANELQGKDGKIQLEETLKYKIDELMQDGQIVKVYITSAILQ